MEGFIINPLTNRPIKVGSKTYKQLVKDNIYSPGVEVDPTDVKIETNETVKKQAGTKKYLKQKKVVAPLEIVNNTVSKTAKTVKTMYPDTEFDDELDSLIMNEMLGITDNKKKSKSKFVIESINEESEDDDEDDEE